MKIQIDTSQDSHEDIKKAIRLLNALLEGTSYTNDTSSNDIFSNPSNDIFSNPTPDPSPEPETPPEAPASGNVLGMFDSVQSISKLEEDQKKDKPDVEFY